MSEMKIKEKSQKKGQTTPLVYVSVLSGTILFSLLMIGISTRFNDINTLAAWSDARSFSQSVSTRAYSSADCFAYETAGAVYSENSKRIIAQRRVYPGVIDVRKFTKDRYFDCIQHYYFSRASTRTLLKDVESTSAAFIEFKLRDLEDPGQVSEYGERTLSTENQLDRQNVVEEMVSNIRKALNKWARRLEWAAFGVQTGLEIALKIASGGSLDTEVDLVILTGYVFKKSQINLPSYMGHELELGRALVKYLKAKESVYSYSTPVVIRYIDEEGHFVEDHMGVLRTKIHYSLYGRK